MVSVIIGRTNKPINSTSQTFADSTSLSCRLKEPCSQQSPVFVVQGLSKTEFYNYAQFMGKYYWVDDIVYETNDIQEVHCHLDPLATYKGAIENSYAFVQYGSADNWNEYIDDIRMQPASRAGGWSTDVTYQCIPGLTDMNDGYVLMRYMDCGFNSVQNPGVKTIAMQKSVFSECLADLHANISPSATIGDLCAQLGGLGNWTQNIVSAVYVPCNLVDTTYNVSQINIGGITCNLHGAGGYMQGVAKTVTRYEQISVPLLSFPQFSSCPFLKNKRWVSIQVSTPFGHADIPFDYIKPSSAANPVILMKSALDLFTGNVVIRFSQESGTDGTGLVLAEFSGNIGIDMMSMIGNEGLRGGLQNAFGTGADLAISAFTLGTSMGMSGTSAFNRAIPSASARREMSPAQKLGALEKAFTAEQQATIASGIDGIPSCLPTGVGGVSAPSGGGVSGFPTLYLTNPKGTGTLSLRLFLPTFVGNSYTNFCDMYGYPVMDYCKLSTTPGFIKCSGATVQGALGATEANKSTINSYLNSGFYLEA